MEVITRSAAKLFHHNAVGLVTHSQATVLFVRSDAEEARGKIYELGKKV
jgi:hypothetical protein